MKRFNVLLNTIWVFAGWLCITGVAQAYALNLPPSYPDLTTFSANYSYQSTCYKKNQTSGDSGLCGTGSGPNAFTGGFVGGVFTITGSVMSINIDGSGSNQVIPESTAYTLIANFNSSGLFTGGTVTAYGKATTDGGTTFIPGFDSGTIITANLTQLGFAGSGNFGTFYFACDSVGGDMAAYYGSYCGVIASTTNMSTSYGTGPAGNWDPSSDNNPNFWIKRNFSGTAAVDTFVPVPAAAWLFLSGLLGLAGVSRRRK